MKKRLILWFDEIGIVDVPIVGGKNASLGEMYRNLTKKGVKVPNGFAITARAYKYFLQQANIEKKIKRILKGLNKNNIKSLQKKGKQVRNLILNSKLPFDLREAITHNYKRLSRKYGIDVAVRSSATAEDLPNASFAGQQETYLNVRGEKDLLNACKKCFASLFTNRAISYRIDKGFDHMKVALSVGVQKMVKSDAAGVMFSIDTESGFKDVVFITGAYGLGENVVQGAVDPDEYYVFKPTLEKYRPILSKKVGSKEKMMVYAHTKPHTNSLPTINIKVREEEKKKFVLNDQEILKLAKWASIIEDHYSKKAGHRKPMDMEWAKQGKELFIVQARPETIQSQKNKNILEIYQLKGKGKIISKGRSVGDKIAKGIAHIIKKTSDLHKFRAGEVLVTQITDPDWEPIMKIASAIVTDHGGRTSHAAIVSRELGIPCVVGCGDATEKIKNKQKITVSCSQGEEGFVYKGLLNYKVKKLNLKHLPKTKTKIMVNIGNPEQAFGLSFLPVQGVGLAREEFIINSYIKIHPKALIEFDKIKKKKENKEIRKQIESLTYGYKDKKQFFVDKLAQGIGMIGAAFYPHPVIVRMSDFKSNEYANLIGGGLFEPKEGNPMIGWRGASRYYNKNYAQAFALECKAMKKVREEFGLTNVQVMIPFCRTVEEGKKVIAEMKKNKLINRRKRKKEITNQINPQIYAMCEIPSNFVLAEEFLDIFDGFSIGSNDLTQLTLGVDRDSELVADVYDERNEAVKSLIYHVIQVANKKGKYIGICGDSVSTFPEIARFLVKAGIHSVSLSPDAVIKTILTIAEAEKRLGKDK